MFARLGRLVARNWIAVIAIWLAVAAALGALAPSWKEIAHDGDLDHLPGDMPSVRGQKLLAEGFPDLKARSQIVVVVEREGAPLSAADFQLAESLARRLAERGVPRAGPSAENLGTESTAAATIHPAADLPLLDVWWHATPIVGRSLSSAPRAAGQATLVVCHLSNDLMATDNMRVLDVVLGEIESLRRDTAWDASGLRLGVTGSAAVGGDMLQSAAESIRNTEWTTIGMVLAILLVVYRAPLLVLVPVITIAVSVLSSISLLALLTQVGRLPGMDWWDLKVFTTTRIFIVVILFGAGTDYCLFLISRYREELAAGHDRRGAMMRALGGVGDALAASALTTIVGLGMMAWADFGKFRHSGVAIATSLVVTLAACVTLAPAMLSALGQGVFWPFAPGRRNAGDARQPRGAKSAAIDGANGGNGDGDDPRAARHGDAGGAFDTAPEGHFNGFWERVARVILARPGLVLVVSCLALLPLAVAGYLRSDVTYDLLGELAPSRPSVVGTRMIERHFPAGEISPLVVLARQRGGGLDSLAAKWEKITPLHDELKRIERVGAVRCLTRPFGESIRVTSLADAFGRRQFIPTNKELAGDLARFDVVLEDPPFSREAVATLGRIEALLRAAAEDRDSPWHGTQFSYAGATAGIRDLMQVTTSDQTRIQWLVVLSVLAVLLAILRRPLVCGWLILSVLLTYFVTIGVTELVFRQAYGETFDGLDWKVPLFLFVLLIAIGQDYNVYLVTRIFEEQQRRGPDEGLRVAVVRTGGIITSCGVIMAATFVSMTTGSLRFMVELGFALSLGVLLDTLVVRPILVPAMVAVLQRRLPGRGR